MNNLKDKIERIKEIIETEVLLDIYQKRLDDFFDDAGIEELEISFGRLTRAKGKEGKGSYILEM